MKKKSVWLCAVNARNPARRVRLRRADSFFSRLRGLLFTRSLPEGEGLLIEPCNSVHMMGMLYCLDIVYLDASRHIIKTVAGLRPWLGMSCCLQAAAVLELPSGTLRRYGWNTGDRLDFAEIEHREIYPTGD